MCIHLLCVLYVSKQLEQVILFVFFYAYTCVLDFYLEMFCAVLFDLSLVKNVQDFNFDDYGSFFCEL